MKFSKHNVKKDRFMLTGPFAYKGYDWWWHSFTAKNAETGEEKPFYVEYFVCNPKKAQDTPVFGQLPENKKNGIRPSYLMVNVGCWGADKRQFHRFFAWKDVKIKKGYPYMIDADDCHAEETLLKGSISITKEQAETHPEWMCDAGNITWNLKVEKVIPFNVGYGTSPILTGIKAFEMYWHAEGMKSRFEGTVTLDGVVYNVEPDTCYGYSDKNWGRGFTSPWVWLSSNNLTSNITGKKLENSVFDIGGGRPKIFFVALNRQLLSAFYYEGETYEFNFSKFWNNVKTEFIGEEKDSEITWFVRQSNRHYVMETRVSCKKTDMLWINYEAPDGSKRHNRLWNGGNGTGNIKLFRKVKGGLELIDDIKAENIGCEYGEYDK